MNTGAYWAITKSGKRYFVLPIRERNEREDDRTFTNGGVSGDGVKGKGSLGGAVTREEADEIFKRLGLREVTELPPGTSPNGYIDSLDHAQT